MRAEDLRGEGSRCNLFVVFGEPDIEILRAEEGGVGDRIRVKINGIDVFHPSSGEVRINGA